MEEDFGLVGKEKVDTYYGTWNGIRDWDTYTGEEK